MKRLAAVAVALVASMGPAADWPQYQGPDRNSISPEKGLMKTWPNGGPRLVWTFKDAGVGYSSPSIVGDRIYITGGRNGDEYLICLDATNAKELWKAMMGPTFNFPLNQWGEGPRTTPTVADGLVYALGGGGELICADAAKGTVVWSKTMVKDLGGAVNPIQHPMPNSPLAWGYCNAPLVDGDNLICFPGGNQGALAALNRKTGAVVWRSSNFKELASYSSPVLATIGGIKQYVVLHNAGVTGVDAKNGNVLWEWKKDPPFGDVIIPTPIVSGDLVHISAGYLPPECQLLEVTKNGNNFAVTEKYKGATKRVMKNSVGGSVLIDGHVYGYSDKVGWVCQELKTGKEMWAQRTGFKAGSLIAAEGNLYCYDETSGDVALVEATPNVKVKNKWNELARFSLPRKAKMRAPSARNWTPPVIANGCLYLRDQELLFCYKIK